MSTETFSRSFRGYRRSEVDTAKMRSDLRIEQLEFELSNMTQRANAMQIEIRDLYSRIDDLRERENSLSASLDEMRARRDQIDREAEARARQVILAAEERSATLKTEGLRQVGELQRQVEQLLGMRSGLTHALQRLSEDIAGAMARVAAAPATAIDHPVEHHVERWADERRGSSEPGVGPVCSVASARSGTPSTSRQPRGSRTSASLAYRRRGQHLAAAHVCADAGPKVDRLVRAGERCRPLGAQRERLPGHVELERLVGRLGAAAKRSECFTARVPVDRPTVVGVDEREILELVAAVDVRHAGRRQLSSSWAERDPPPSARDLVEERIVDPISSPPRARVLLTARSCSSSGVSQFEVTFPSRSAFCR